MNNFKEMGLDPKIIKSLEEINFTSPSPIQAAAIPYLLESENDLIALAQTGTGKTAAFTLPILHKIKHSRKELQAIILCPTRELCLQLHADIKRFSKHSEKIEVTAVYGGERIDLQIKALRSGTNIVVGTPGRVMDLIRRKVLQLNQIRWVVLDEADEMLDMGFKDDLDAILSETPSQRQTLLFSATMSKSVRDIAKNYMHDVHEISIGTKNRGADNISHEYYIVHASDRFEALKRVIDFLPGIYGILFCRTKIETQKIADQLKQSGYDAEPIHGDISQTMRTKIMDRFKKKQISLLVATDVAARGIDVSDLSHVINYNLPDQDEIYTHRSGRTGRAQKSGISVSILTPREVSRVKSLEKIIGKSFELKKIPNQQEIFNKQIDNFLESINDVQIDETMSQYHEIEEKLKKIKKEDLVRFLIIDKLSRFGFSSGSSDNINAQGKQTKERISLGDEADLKINLGKKHGFTVKSLFGLFNSSHELKQVKIGKISLYPEYSVFSVEKDDVERVAKLLSNTKYKGRNIEIGESKGDNNYTPQRKGSYKKFAKKKPSYSKKRY